MSEMAIETVPGTPATRRRFTRDPNKSRITNGLDLLPGDVDGRSAVARRYRDIVNAVLADQGGADRCSESRLQLVRRFAASAVLAEALEAKLVLGQDIDVSQHSLLCSRMVRLSTRIGIGRRLRNIVPDPLAYGAEIDRLDAARHLDDDEVVEP
jgi:hypothetical protein